MRKRLLVVLLTASLATSVLAGCGSETVSDNASVESSVEESTEEGTQESAEVESTEESSEESTEENTEETVEESTQESTQESIADSNEISDWSTAYEGYFDREDIISENAKITMLASMEGVTYTMVVAQVDGVSVVSMDFGVASIDIYETSDKLYACAKAEGVEEWTYAPIASEEEAEETMSMGEDVTIDTETITSYSYKEEVVEDGVVYDVLDITMEEDGNITEGVCYVNRETQKLAKYDFSADDQVMICTIEEIDTITIPEAAANATESTSEDISMSIFGVMLMGMTSAMEETSAE